VKALRRAFRIAALVLFVGILLAAIVGGKLLGLQKSFSLPRVAVEATLDPDGTMHVVEHITYDFNGNFHYGTRPIPVGNYEITDMTVTEHGQPVTSVGAPYNLTFYFDATDETRTFDIAYTVHRAVTAGSDVGVLYWKWIGETHPTIGLATASLRVPPGAGEVKAWGHGPLNGVVAVTGDTVTWRTRDLPQGSFLEGRVAVPMTRLPGLAPGATALLPRVLQEEGAWARAANDARREAADQAARDRRIHDGLLVGAPLVAFLGAVLFLWLWKRYGQEPKTDPSIGEYVRDLPEDPPAVVASLLHWGAHRNEGFSATVLDLARRGYLSIRETREERAFLPDRHDYELTAGKPPDGELKEFETKTLELVFHGRTQVLHSEIGTLAREHQTESLANWNAYKTSVAASLRARHYINGHRSKPFLLNVVAAVLVGIVGGFAIAYGAWVLGVTALAWGAVQLFLTPLLRQRSPEGQNRYHQWLGVRNYLRDFSQLADAPAGHLILWEQYLVYAVALEVSDELAAGLAAKLPPEEQPTFAPWFIGSHPTGSSSFGSIGNFASGLGASTGSFTPPSSSSGGGGGFSGGGGGGGGGGGIGAG
jgi:uncharacterized membrane protein